MVCGFGTIWEKKAFIILLWTKYTFDSGYKLSPEHLDR